MKLAPITRIGAPLAKARSTAAVPTSTPKSALPEITACTRLAAARGAEDLEREPMLLEDAGLLAEDRSPRPPRVSSWPIATLRVSGFGVSLFKRVALERFLGGRRRRRRDEQRRRSSRRQCDLRSPDAGAAPCGSLRSPACGGGMGSGDRLARDIRRACHATLHAPTLTLPRMRGRGRRNRASG